MFKQGVYQNIKPVYIDLFFISALLLLNPAFVYINHSPRIFYMDTLIYLAMAGELFSSGQLFVASWGHVDTGVILSPVYPLFIAFGNIFSNNLLLLAEMVSSVCAITASIIFYFILRKIMGRFFALLTLLVIQINYHYFYISLSPLTEASFLLALSISSWMAMKVVSDPENIRNIDALLLGVACGLTFLTRQIGLSFLIYIVLFMLLTGNYKKYGALAGKLFIILAGFTIMFAPYSTALYLQTETHPFQQEFRMGQYKILSNDSKVLAEISAIDDIPENSYEDIYSKRRLMFKLLPDSSEMYANIFTGAKNRNNALAVLSENLGEPLNYYKKVSGNVGHLTGILGQFMMFSFLLSCLLPFVLKYSSKRDLKRILLPAFVIFYMLLVSAFTDKIPRYIIPIFPFCVIHVFSEFYTVTNKIFSKKSAIGCFILFVGLSVLFLPRSYKELPVYEKVIDSQIAYAKIKEYVGGDTMFALAPYHSYVAGAKYRTMPNDTLDKVAQYGKKTGVKWIIVNRVSGSLQELIYYNNLDWYLNPGQFDPDSKYIEYCCGTDDALVSVFKIL